MPLDSLEILAVQIFCLFHLLPSTPGTSAEGNDPLQLHDDLYDAFFKKAKAIQLILLLIRIDQDLQHKRDR